MRQSVMLFKLFFYIIQLHHCTYSKLYHDIVYISCTQGILVHVFLHEHQGEGDTRRPRYQDTVQGPERTGVQLHDHQRRINISIKQIGCQ